MVGHAGKKLSLLLAEKGMQQKDLAVKLGKTPQGIYQLKKSKRFQWETINRLSAVFDVPCSYFMS